jgi:hypothetical protein
MIKNRHPLPLIDETLDKLMKAKIFIKLNLKDAYHHVRIYDNYKWKIAFKTCYGHFKYLVMPFKLTNALITFQAYINMTLINLLNHFIIIYLNDILIYS